MALNLLLCMYCYQNHIGRFLFELLWNNYKDKAKILLEQYPAEIFTPKRLLINFLNTWNSFKYDGDV